VYQEAVTIEPMIKEVLNMSTKIDLVLDMKEKLEELASNLGESRLVLDEMKELALQAKNSSMLAVNMVNKANIIEKRIDEKLNRMEAIEKTMKEFSVKVEHVGSERGPAHAYDCKTNTLELVIPRGKMGPRGQFKGDTGESGKDGKDFQPTVMGPKGEMPHYGNRPIGTSYLSLDEIPTMIYFRKSNNPNDWTDGQPFGVGGNFYTDTDTSIVDGINIQKLTDEVINELHKRERVTDG
jgi:predicted DNA-binding protein